MRKGIKEINLKELTKRIVAWVFKFLNRFMLIRFGIVNERAIGHLIIDTELNYLRSIDTKIRKYDIWVSNNETVNITVSKFWKKFLPIKGGRVATKFYNLVSQEKSLKPNLISAEVLAGDGRHWDYTESLFEFVPKELSRAHRDLELLGLSAHKKTVLVCLRDETYYLSKSRGDLEELHRHRNVDVEQYKEAVNYLLSRNYQVVRMGRGASVPISISAEGFIDLPFCGNVKASEIGQRRRENLELLLAQICSFTISSGLGIDSLATLFRKRVYLCDFFSTYQLYGSNLFPFFLPKGLEEKSTGKLIGFKEIFDSAYFDLKFAPEFEGLGIKFRNCNANSIRDFFVSIVDYEESGRKKMPMLESETATYHENAIIRKTNRFKFFPKISPLWENYYVE